MTLGVYYMVTYPNVCKYRCSEKKKPYNWSKAISEWPVYLRIAQQHLPLIHAPLSLFECWAAQGAGSHGRKGQVCTEVPQGPQKGASKSTFTSILLWQKSVSSQCTRMEWNNEALLHHRRRLVSRNISSVGEQWVG